MFKLSVWLSFSSCISGVMCASCGRDELGTKIVTEGSARMETYPWLGILFYPYNKKRLTTAVVLVTRQVVLASATEIDKLPKDDFRAKARVVIGHNCSTPGIRIRDYTYHPDYPKETYNTIAMIQLETDHVKTELRPICPPPTDANYRNYHFYAMLLSNENCKRSKVKLYKMSFVETGHCHTFYRRTGLDINSMWPTHTVCAKSVTGGECIWRSGAILVVKLYNRWRLLGFGVYGPGCEAPARFIDYGMYHKWVQRRVDRIGIPAITTLADNHIVLRRSMSNIQRYGSCDKEETQRTLYTDTTKISMYRSRGVTRYNLTIIAGIEYSCLTLQADYENKITRDKPRLKLRRWCTGDLQICYTGLQFTEMYFYAEITFKENLQFHVAAYGQEVASIDPSLALKHANSIQHYPSPGDYQNQVKKFWSWKSDNSYPLYGKKRMKERLYTKGKLG